MGRGAITSPMTSPASPSSGGCFSWLAGRRRDKQQKQLFIKSASSKGIIAKHMNQDKTKESSNKVDWNLVEDWSSSSEKSDQNSPVANSVDREDDVDDFGDTPEPSTRSKNILMIDSRTGSAAVSPGEGEGSQAGKAKDRVANRRPLSSMPINANGIEGGVRFGLEEGTKIRFPGQDITPVGKGAAKPRGRKLTYYDSEEKDDDAENRYFSGEEIIEMELPGSMATPPGKGSRIERKKDARKAWGYALKSDWLGGMR